MVSDDTTDAKFTSINLAVAKDSGWYEIDLSLGEYYFWGKNEGCSIFEKTCSHTTVSEFCNENGKKGCNDDHMYTTLCDSDEYTGSCNINLNIKSCKVSRPDKDAFAYGKDSLCLSGKVNFFLIILSFQTMMNL